jgi:Tfp pilus assembly protein PilW
VRGLSPRLRATQAGISLVETLVALVLGLAMVSVAFNLYVSNRAVFRQVEAMVRLQESASIATALLETDIRHAAGTLCRNNPPTTSLLATPNVFWDTAENSSNVFFVGLRGYESIQTDLIVGDKRLAGDSISIMSDNMGKVARVTAPAISTSAEGSGGLIGSYTFPVDNGSNFPVGTVAMACDYTRAVLFQVTASTDTTITLQAGEGGGPSPGNCAVTMRRGAQRTEGVQNGPVAAMDGPYSCHSGRDPERTYGQMYPFGPGSMVAEHSFHHWYIGRKKDTTDGLSLYRVSMGYDTSGNVKLLAAEEMVQDVTDMQITYLPGRFEGYPAKSYYIPSADNVNFDDLLSTIDPPDGGAPFIGVTAVRIMLTLTSPDKVGLAANNTASAATYTIPINVAIRARMPGMVRR